MYTIVCDCCGQKLTDSSRYCCVEITSTRVANEHFDLCPKCADAIRAVITNQALIMDRKNGDMVPLIIENIR
jgi:hypothetical protein